MVTHSEDVGTGLLTTWDLFRLVRGQSELGWPIEHIKPLFYKSGRIFPIPAHYLLLGTVAEVFEPAFILVTEREVKKDDRLAWEVGTGCAERVVRSLERDDTSVESADTGTELGIQTEPHHGKLKVRQRIYRVAV